MEVLSKILVTAHESILGSSVNVKNKTKQNFFVGMQFLRQTIPHHVQLSLLMKRSGIRIVMARGESNCVL